MRSARLAPTVAVAATALWLTFPWLADDRIAFDAAPFVAAVRLVPDDAGEIYPGPDGHPSERFTTETCAAYEQGARCGTVAGFVSAPPSLIAAWPLRWLAPLQAVSVVRAFTVAALLLGAACLWRHLAVDREGAWIAASSIAALTPGAAGVVSLGQTSPILMLVPLLAVGRGPRRQTALGLAVGSAALLKVFPGVLLAVALWQRRGRTVAAAVAVAVSAAVLAAVLLPLGLYRDWIEGVVDHGQLVSESPWNGGLETLAFSAGLPKASAWVVRLLLLPLVVLAVARASSEARAWALAMVGLLVLSPQLWAHYLLVPVAAIAVLTAGRARWAVVGAAVWCSWVNYEMDWVMVHSDLLRAAIWLLPMAVLGYGALAGDERAGIPAEPRVAGRVA